MSQDNQVFLDTSFLVAYHNKKDQNHLTATICYNNLKRSISNLRFVTTDYIFDELATLLLVRLDKERAIKICSEIIDDPLIRLFMVSEKYFKQAWDVYKSMLDKDWSFTDCSSYVVMQELGIDKAASFDHHFKQFGFTILP